MVNLEMKLPLFTKRLITDIWPSLRESVTDLALEREYSGQSFRRKDIPSESCAGWMYDLV